MVRLEFTIDLDYEISAPSDFVFAIAAAKTPPQRVVGENLQFSRPVASRWVDDAQLGTRLLRVRAGPGALHVAYAGCVDIRHHLCDPATLRESAIDAIPDDVLQFLAASRYCQSDRLIEFAHTEFGAGDPGYARVERIRRWVRDYVRFSPGASTTATTALDTLADRRGVCRDFAHLMIALCRAVNVPARIVTGVDYGADPQLGPCDFHAYVEAWLGDRWFLFDPTEISPVEGLVRIGTGRDAADVAFATIYGAVRTFAPVIGVKAIEDAAKGIRLPSRTQLAVSTTGPPAHEPRPASGHQEAVLPWLLHSPPQGLRPQG